MVNYKVIVYPNSRISSYKNDLACFGFKYNERENIWVKSNINSSYFVHDIELYCQRKHLKCEIIDENYERSNNYRKEFFKKHNGIKNYYLCAYCGHICDKRHITIDHIVPVDAGKHSKSARFFLKIFGIHNINDTKNLTPSCSSCNSKKSSHIFGWLIRGWFGKFDFLYIPRMAIIVLIIFLIIFTLIYFLTFRQLPWGVFTNV